MRILIVHNRYRSSQPSGENAVVEDESQLLADFGHEVERLEVESDEIVDWPLRKKATLPLRVIWSAKGYRLTRDSIRRSRPDVVHIHNTFPLLSPSSVWAASRSGVPVVHTLHNFRPLCPAGTFLREGRICEECIGRFPWPAVRHGCYRGSRRASLPVALMDGFHNGFRTWERCVDIFVAPSEFTREKYIQAGWSPDRILTKFNTAPEPATRRSGHGSGFVCLSRLVPEKGVDVLLKAWGEAFPDGTEHLTIVGSGEAEPSLRNMALGLNGVSFVGQVGRERAMEILKSARALVVPSRGYEVFPRTVVEAYALAVPVIASRVGALAEVVEDGETGVLVAPESSSDLAGALRSIASSDPLAKRLGEGARRAYDDRLSPRRTTDQLLAIYDRAAATAGSAGRDR